MTNARFQAVLEGLFQGQQDQAVRVIGVCGFAGAGKTTLCQSLVTAHPERFARLECDRFSTHSHKDRQARIAQARQSGNAAWAKAEENPANWYDWDGIGHALHSLRQDRHFKTDRAWNRETGQLDACYGLSVGHNGPVFILCDCIYLLHDPVRSWLDGTVFVDCPQHLLETRRRQRSQSTQREKEAAQRFARYEVPYFKRFRDLATLCFASDH